MIAKTVIEFNESQYAHLKETLNPKDYQEFINFKKREKELNEYQKQQRLDGRKKEAGQDFFTRRDSLIVRRAKARGLDLELAPEEDALASIDIQKLLKAREEAAGTYQEKMKLPVSDDEIKAFLELEREGHYFKDITLEMIESKISPDKGTEDKAKKDEPEAVDIGEEGGKVVEVQEYSVEDVPSDESATYVEATEEDTKTENPT